ncbi:TetR family transcriptional regulator [Vitiosangium sp. GDMCC 1.1324]|uniref:TetR family transcriptional regulator n=1 Tax=Vitiosangium sp. (strain GDMCC 1.1324) TaxID=2138576 RepID=UPI000D390E9B|nr:TetR family transcriptional regulator [Vitiosangium sp. GDMCC 1.1324]PTL82090.1 TetR family transcriptional regulator [Vitiosangium sp. GDMCC 1.1324]
MKRVLLSLLLSLTLGMPARAASGVDSLRTEAQAGRAQVRELRERQQALRSELNTLAGRIEQLKAEQKGRLVAGPALEAALRRSQELSGQLTGLAQSLAGAESEAERRNLALHAALSDELARVRAAWDSTSDREARSRLIARMRDLRAERDAVRAALPPSQVPALNPAEASDDPEDLLEQADALRDSEDKVRQRLQALRARITEVREERELDRRMSDFLGEESMFDEQDRHMRLRFDSSTKSIAVDAAQRQPGLFSPRGFLGETPSADSAPPPPESNAGSSPDAPPTQTPGGGKTDNFQPITYRASDNRPQVGAVRAQVLASGNPDDLRSLEQEAKQLESLARELDSRAESLERRAHELR